jgi:hypothetical protein
MSRKKRFRVKQGQKNRRHERLKKLRAKKANIEEYFYNGRYIGPRNEK